MNANFTAKLSKTPLKCLEVSYRFWPIDKTRHPNNWNESKEQQSRFITMLLGILGGNLLRDLLSDKSVMQAGDAVIRVHVGIKKK